MEHELLAWWIAVSFTQCRRCMFQPCSSIPKLVLVSPQPTCVSVVVLLVKRRLWSLRNLRAKAWNQGLSDRWMSKDRAKGVCFLHDDPLMKELQIPYIELDGSEPKNTGQCFLKQNMIGSHLFDTVGAMTSAWHAEPAAAYCHLHQDMCTIDKRRCDMYIAGPPCNPYSTQRSNRGTVGFFWKRLVGTPSLNLGFCSSHYNCYIIVLNMAL